MGSRYRPEPDGIDAGDPDDSLPPERRLPRRNSCRVAPTRDSAADQEQSSALHGLTGKRTGLNSTKWTNNSFTGKKPTDLEELREMHEFLKLQRQYRVRNMFLAPIRSCCKAFNSFARSNYFFDPSSALLMAWDWLVVGLAIYSVIYAPLSVVLKQTRWQGYKAFETALDIIFCTVRHSATAGAAHPRAAHPRVAHPCAAHPRAAHPRAAHPRAPAPSRCRPSMPLITTPPSSRVSCCLKPLLTAPARHPALSRALAGRGREAAHVVSAPRLPRHCG